MNELALFSGAGGGILGGHLLGWRCVCAVEFDAFCARRLMQRQNEGHLPPFPIWDDVRTFDGHAWRGIVDVVSGGFPCQDISAAGKGAGIEGERSGLWVEMARIIREVQPRFAFVENSPILTSRGLGVVLGDLAEMGFDARWGVFSAADAGAPHLRERIWIVADSSELGRRTGRTRRSDSGSEGQSEQPLLDVDNTERERCHARRHDHREHDRHIAGAADQHTDDVADAESLISRARLREDGTQRHGHQPADGGGDVADADRERQLQPDRRITEIGRRAGHDGETLPHPMLIGSQGQQQAGPETWPAHGSGDGCDTRWWLTEPDVGRVAHGVAARVDQLRALGNGQVPAVAALAWEMLSNE